MKKGVFGKKQLTLAVMAVALCGAVWLNMEYSASGGGFSEETEPTASYLGQAQFVNGQVSDELKETSGNVQGDYFETTRRERNEAREAAIDELEDTVSDAKINDEVKKAAVEKLTALTTRMDTEASIEALLKAIKITNYSDSKAFANEYTESYIGKDSSLEGIDTYAGVTYSSRAFKDAISDAFVGLNMAIASEKEGK